MTGFGAAEGPVGAGRLKIEIRTVNHRHLNVQCKLPAGLQAQESVLRETVRANLERGHVSISAQWVEGPEAPTVVRLDAARARDTLAALRELKSALGLTGDIVVSDVARFPGVITAADTGEAPAPEASAAEVEAVATGALRAVADMRRREGAVLATELLHRLDTISTELARVKARAPERVVAERDRLQKAVQELLDGRQPDPDRLAQEIALLADRLDITEETVRLAAHVNAARETLGADKAVGRELGFLGQEMLREINTIGSKANDAEIARAVITMKGELEKFREQVENVE